MQTKKEYFSKLYTQISPGSGAL